MHQRVSAAALVLGAALVAPSARSGPAGPQVPRLVDFSGSLEGVEGRTLILFSLYADDGSPASFWTEAREVVVDG